MDNIRALFFDAGGTVFDWKNTARANIQELADAKGQEIDSEAFAYDWRGEMFKIHTQVRHGNLPWCSLQQTFKTYSQWEETIYLRYAVQKAAMTTYPNHRPGVK